MADSHLKPGDLMAFLVAAQTIQRSLAQLSLLFGQAIRGMSAGSRVFEYIEMKPTIPVKADASSVRMDIDQFIGRKYSPSCNESDTKSKCCSIVLSIHLINSGRP